jgi:PilZ domain
MPRQFKRFPITLEITIDFATGRRDARISDLSLGGCFVDSILDINAGEKTDFSILIPTGEWLKLTGEIIHSITRIGFGIRFINLTEDQRFLIEQTILTYGGDPQALADPEDSIF